MSALVFKEGFCAYVISTIISCEGSFKVLITVKPILSGHSKKDKASVLKTNGSIMKRNALLEHSAILDLH